MAASPTFVFAVPKGSLFSPALDVLAQVGIDVVETRENLRKQLFAAAGIMTMRPSDVVTYVAAGVADMGIAGKDTIAENAEPDAVYEMLDLRFGACRMVLATVAGNDDPVERAIRLRGVARIATKYPRTAQQWAQRTGRAIDIVELKGSVELAPVVGMADGIVDLVDTGGTLAANGLVEREPIAVTSARLIVNPVTYSEKSEAVRELVDRFVEHLG